MTQKELIRQEIERRKKYESENYHDRKADGRPNEGWAESLAIMGELEELLFFIDSLPEEIPPYCTGFKGDPDPAGTDDLEEAAARYERENRQSILSSVDIVNAFIAGAEWRKKHLAVEDIKATLDISFWNDDPQKILEEYNRICDTSKVTRR